MQKFIVGFPEWLVANGCACILTFQPLEEKMIRLAMQLHGPNRRNAVSFRKHPVSASQHEMKLNPRSRAAKLHIAKRQFTWREDVPSS